MTEVLPQTRPPETLPENLTFERIDDAGSGIATLPDGRYVIEIGERMVGKPPEAAQRFDLSLAGEFIRQEPDIATWYGYEYIPSEDGGLARVIIPSPEQLNERKNSLPPEIGVNRGVFRVEEGAHFTAAEYLGMLSERQIPIATELDAKAHDLCAHTGGFAIMSAEMFDYITSKAKSALQPEDAWSDDFWSKYFVRDVTGMIDSLSGWLTAHPSSRTVAETIQRSHSAGMPSKTEMGELVESLYQSQLRTNEAFREYARSQNALAR